MEKQMEAGEFDQALINFIVFNHQMESNVIKCNQMQYQMLSKL